MQAAAALRLARTRSAVAVAGVSRQQAPRCFATTTLDASAAASATSSAPAAAAPTPAAAPIPLSNVEAQWEMMQPEERHNVHQQLEELQKKDWKSLSVDEKKAAYYVAFGPHGPRTPSAKPGDAIKITASVLALIGASGLLYAGIRAIAPESPKTNTREWEEATNERALEQKMNPITGISSEGYKGKGFVSK